MGFEGVIRDHLDWGRPDPIALVFHRPVTRGTPGTFRTRVLTQGVDPTLGCSSQSSRIKPYFKEGGALRTETVIRDTHDFRIGRRVCAQNGYALRAVGESANRCRWDPEAADALPAPEVATFCRVTQPSATADGLPAAGLRFGEARVMAVLAAGVGFCHLLAGFSNRQIVKRVAALGAAPYRTRQATYDLRRLKRQGLMVKLAHTHRSQLPSLGRRVAVRFTKTYGRVLAPGWSALDLRLPEDLRARSPLTRAWRTFERTLDDYIQAQMIAA
jgi:hypothetical protein